MPSPLGSLDPRRPPLRWILRAPLVLYRLRLGWLLGGRFAQLTVRGRRSGSPRTVVLEVLRRDPESGAVWVASAWGERAQWFRNLAAHPAAAVCNGFRRFDARAEMLDETSAERELARYAAEHRLAYRWFIGPLLTGGGGSGAGSVAAAARGLRIVRLIPAHHRPTGDRFPPPPHPAAPSTRDPQ